MDNLEFEVKENNYRVNRLSAKKQFNIVRRVVPFFGELAPMVSGAEDNKNDLGMKALKPLSDALASMSDEASDYVLFGLLECVQRKEKQGLGWSKVCVDGNLMYQDIDMTTMILLAFNSAKVNYQDFFSGITSKLTAANQKKQ